MSDGPFALRIALCCSLASCGGDVPRPAGEPWFAVRGRWPTPAPIRVEVRPVRPDDAAGTVSQRTLEAAFDAAAEAWNAVGGPGFVRVDVGAPADLTLGFERGSHGPCQPFGGDPSRAHTGPVEPGTFIHLDAGRTYGPGEFPLARVLLHELGHVLGLDHVEDVRSVMHATPSADRLGPTDRAGVHSLYGGGRPGPGDLLVSASDGGEPLAVLHGVAPPGRVAWSLFDLQGDGSDELFLWRTDPEGYGRVQVLSFGPGGRPRASYFLEGLALAGAPLHAFTASTGVRFVVVPRPSAEPLVFTFEADGRPRPWQSGDPLPFELDQLPGPRTSGDLDGDGQPEFVRPR